VYAFIPVLGPDTIFRTPPGLPREHARVPRQVEDITQDAKGLFRLGKQRFCGYNYGAVSGMLENAVLMRVAQIEHRGTCDVGPVGGQDPVGMPGEDDVTVVGAIDILPRQSLEVVGHVLQKEDVISSTRLKSLEG
jgi:hypothetical protein